MRGSLSGLAELFKGDGASRAQNHQAGRQIRPTGRSDPWESALLLSAKEARAPS
jgi:hypothetical protein